MRKFPCHHHYIDLASVEIYLYKSLRFSLWTASFKIYPHCNNKSVMFEKNARKEEDPFVDPMIEHMPRFYNEQRSKEM